MRLSPHDREAIRRAAGELAGPEARVLLFGSRTNDVLVADPSTPETPVLSAARREGVVL